MRRALIAGIAFLSLAALPQRVRAANSGRLVNAAVSGTIFRYPITQGPTEDLTFTTSGLSTGSDTVIHIQDADDPQNGFLAGNDDYAFPALASRAGVNATGGYRHLLVLVRSYGASSQGTCTLTTLSSTWGAWDTAVTFGGAKHYLGGNTLQAGAHVSTVERQGGATDTVLLLGSGFAYGHGFDDNDGVGEMSFVHNPSTATGPYAIVGHASGTAGPSTVDIVWDDDADTTDYDSDGLGATLEAALGTCPGPGACPDGGAPPDDTDEDGLRDGDEVLGNDTSPPLKFPAWGADPTQKDLFIEVDWAACTTEGCNSQDDYRYSPSQVPQVKADFLPVRVHMDIGQTNTDPATWFDWGNWGGAERRTETNLPLCIGFSPNREHMFHHSIITGGNAAAPFGMCQWGANHGIVTSHELGHNMGLTHTGRPFTADVAGKPNYVSRMSYVYQNGAPSFSHGTNPALNATALDEQRGLCTTDAYVLSSITGFWCRGATCVQDQGLKCPGNIPTKAIDWNRDGVYEGAGGPLVRGGPAMHWVSGTPFGRTEFSSGNLRDPAMTWVNVGGQVGNWLVVAGRGPNGELQWTKTTKTLIDSGCNAFSTPWGWGDLNCAGFAGAPTNVPGSVIEKGPGVAELSGGVLLVYQSGVVKSQTLSVNSTTGQVTYGSIQTLPKFTMGSNVVVTSDVAVLSTGPGVVMAWARDNSTPARLKQWKYQNSAWSLAADERWEDAANGHPFINPLYGIGVTRGFQNDITGARTYAAIPDGANGGRVEFARRDDVTGRWTKISAWTGPGTLGVQPSVQARPGLAFQPTLSATAGRFYMALNLPASCAFTPDPSGSFGGTCETKLIMTEGNRVLANPQNRRLVWIAPSHTFSRANEGALGGVALMNDATRDVNLRGLKTYPDGQTAFFPLSDGAVNVTMSDLDDYVYLKGALRASLGIGEFTLP